MLRSFVPSDPHTNIQKNSLGNYVDKCALHNLNNTHSRFKVTYLSAPYVVRRKLVIQHGDV